MHYAFQKAPKDIEIHGTLIPQICSNIYVFIKNISSDFYSTNMKIISEINFRIPVTHPLISFLITIKPA